MKKILIVDDDPMIRKMVSALLTKEGYKIETVENGKDGLEKLTEYIPDLIISDVLMPEMDGYEFTTRLRRQPRTQQIPLLMLTSLDTVDEKIKGFEVGADDFIVKPFEPREFLARVAILVKRSEQIQAAPAAEQVQGKCISVFSLRGGAGVSTIAGNLAVGFSQIWNHPAALVDMVLTGGQTALYLNLALKNTWAELAQFPADEIDLGLVRSALLPHESGVATLASPRRPEKAEAITYEKVEIVLNHLKNSHEYVVLDLPHDFDSTTLAALDQSDTILLVLQPEIVSVRSAVIALETFSDLGYEPDKVNLVLNWTFPRQGISNADIEKSLRKQISLVIPYADDPMMQGLNLGQPPVLTSPDSPLGILFEDLAMALSKSEHRKQKPDEPSAGWLRVVERVRQRKAQKK